MIHLTQSDGIATITLDRPASRNALRVAAWHDLAGIAARIPDDTAVTVIASATRGVFSAGADLTDLATLADDIPGRAAFRLAMRAAVDAIAALPMPVIAAVDGACFGAAVALVLACDLIVATPAARFAIPPARLGIAYPAADIARLLDRVGKGASRRLLYTADAIPADEAHRIGLVDLIDDGRTVATRVAANDGAALAVLKRMVADPANPAHDAAFDRSFASPAFLRATTRYR